MDILTHWSIGSPLLHQGVEEADPEEQLLPDLLFAGAEEEVGVRDGVVEVGAQHVGSQAFGRLVGHLDPVLQDAHRELV